MTNTTVKTETHILVPFIKTRKLHKKIMLDYLTKIIRKRADNQIEKLIEHLDDKATLTVRKFNINSKSYEDIADMEKSLNHCISSGKTRDAYLTIRLTSFRHYTDKASITYMNFSHAFQLNTDAPIQFEHIEYVSIAISQLEDMEAIVNLLGV